MKSSYRRTGYAVVVLVLSVVFLVWGAPSGRPVRDTETLGVLTRGTVVAVLDEQEHEREPGSRGGITQLLEVAIDEHRSVEVVNDIIPVAVGRGVYLNEVRFAGEEASYTIVDIERSGHLLILVGVFSALVLLVARREGLYALSAMALSSVVVFRILVPGILTGWNPILLTLLCAIPILLGTFWVGYGFSRKSLCALAAISITLCVVALFAHGVVDWLSLTGYADDSSLYLNSETNNGVDLVALVVAGILIAALGVLDDVAITQVSTVYALARSSALRGRELYREAMRVGTDHIGALVNTLLLAYVGAALPLLLLLQIGSFPISFSVGGEPVAQEIVRTLLASGALVLVVPLSTLFAVLAVRRWGSEDSDDAHHGHAH